MALALVATAFGLQRVTSARGKAPVHVLPPAEMSGEKVYFHLVLSAPAESVEIDTGKLLRPAVTGSTISGTLEMDPSNPRAALVVHWKQSASPGEHRFAKLTLDPPRRETITHVFDAPGDIDDIVELPLPVGK